MQDDSSANGDSDAKNTPLAALAGLNVLDFSHALAGPYCTLVLAQYGATIYKLESPEGGDMGRGWGPPFTGGHSHFYLGINRGKHGISIDLKRPEGIALCMRLVEKMDVLIENFRPGTMDRLGLGYEAVHARNPALVYCSISGYGQNGPARDEAAMDLIVQSSTGLLSMTGPEGGDPVRSGYSAADITAGMFAIIGILMALRARENTGQGQFVDVAMFDGLISAMSASFMVYLGSDVCPRPMGTAYQNVVPYRVFKAQDRSFALAVGSEKLWSAFCRAIARPELERHPDFANNPLRAKNRVALERILQDVFSQQLVGDWLDKLRAAGIPCSLVCDFHEVVTNPQSAFRGLFPTIDHPGVGSYRVTGDPIKMSRTPARPTMAAPLLGEHTRLALSQLLDLDVPTLDALAASHVIFERVKSSGMEL